ncbi:hypothetical protein FM114_00850 [Luteococcus japonicus LSP_Lj1]|uniref:Uncharacterized protein n=1 Tax=Luteococcus japonicus LSP_Lj1 TaxID=1255658 RepID=A0A1R4ID09_9ACTN|nr:hypothetical protein FM114_00850 [Luteococcus japonicus LSP_Lj1]
MLTARLPGRKPETMLLAVRQPRGATSTLPSAAGCPGTHATARTRRTPCRTPPHVAWPPPVWPPSPCSAHRPSRPQPPP